MTTKRFLMASWGGGGNVPPAFALANRLVDAGHEVAVIADAEPIGRPIAENATTLGVKLLEYPSVERWPQGIRLEDDPVRFDDVRNGIPTAKDILAAAEGFQPDAMIVDCMSGAGLVAAELLGLPTAVLVHVLYQPFVSYWADLAVNVNRCREAFGMRSLDAPAVLEQLKRAAKVLVLVPEAFDYPGAPRTDQTHYVGPILDPRIPDPPGDLGFEPSDSRPLVLVSLSTTPMGQREALPPILEALGTLPIRGLLTLGGVDPGEQTLPDNVVVRDYLPHAGVLGHVSAVVSHGGLSTIMAALAHGVPMACIPQGREQPLNAERVQACGAGINVPADSGPRGIADAITRLLDDPTYAAAAQSMSGLIQRLGSGTAAVGHVEALRC